ncbi:hypothetical protein [Natronorubrum sulfidifaciens]|nr:hypothetical protein [Natronorubrum sulfidifaciens]
MTFDIFDGTAEWYSTTITGYIIAASAVSISLTAGMALGVL